jgi:hypothetical protein
MNVMAIFQQLTILRIDFHSVGAGFYITLIGAAVLLAMFYLHYQRRAAAMRAWNVIEGKGHGVRVVAFDCRLGTGKGSWRRSVIAAEGSAEVFGMFNPELAAERSGGWVLLYQPKAVSLIPKGLMTVTEIEACLTAVTQSHNAAQ